MELLLIRGLGRESDHWQPFLSQLAKTLAEHKELKGIHVKCLDLPGCGQHFKQTAFNTIKQNTDFLRKQHLPAQHPDEPQRILIGLSMGGMVALDWSQRYPNEIAGLIMINSSSAHQPFWRRFSIKYYAHILVTMFSPMRQREKRILQLVTNVRPLPKSVIQHWVNIQNARPINRHTFLNMLRAAAGYTPKTFASPKPFGALIITSEQDRLVSHECSKDLARRSRWPIKVNTSAGHDIPLDAPQWLVEQILSFLSSSKTSTD